MTHAPLAHVPVLCAEAIEALAPAADRIFVDGTFGAGGYTTALLEAGAGHVYGIDQDPNVASYAQAVAQRFPGRFTFVQGRFGDMRALLAARDVTAVDGIVLDIGMSSMQVDDPARGFSFQATGPLDMRMGTHGVPVSALLDTVTQDALAEILYTYGGERHATRVARAILQAHAESPLTTTTALAEVIIRTLGWRRHDPHAIHPATRTFQGLRIWANDELGQLQQGLYASIGLLRAAGRLAVISFHSCEDGIVKAFLRTHSGYGQGRVSRYAPVAIPAGTSAAAHAFTLLYRGAVMPSSAEVAANPRSRSARLRAAVRTAHATYSQPGGRT